MRIIPWLSNISSRFRFVHRRRKRAKAVCTALERLEDRVLLAGNVEVKAVGGHLVIEGDQADNAITVDQSGLAPGSFRITGADSTMVNGAATPVVVNGVTRDVRVTLDDGSDHIRIENSVVPRNLRIDGGDGGNTVEIVMTEIGRDLRIDNDDGFDVLSLQSAVVGRKTNVDNGDGGTDTEIYDSSLGRDLNIDNDDGFDEFFMQGTDVERDLKIDNGHGGSRTEITTSTLGRDLSLKNKSGFDDLLLGQITVDRKAKVDNGGGGSRTVISESQFGDDLKFKSKNGSDDVRLHSATVHGDSKVDTGRDDDSVSLSNSTFSDDFRWKAGAGTDRFVDGITTDVAMDGTEVVDPVSTSAHGSTSVELQDDGRLWFAMTVSDIVGVTEAHLHLGGPGENGPIVATLFGLEPAGVSVVDETVIARGALGDDDVAAVAAMDFDGTVAALVSRIREGTVYADVHTLGEPAGEIRGQLDSGGNVFAGGLPRLKKVEIELPDAGTLPSQPPRVEAADVASAAVRFLRSVTDPTSGLPFNEAKQSELESDPQNLSSNFFVPAQLGNLLTAMVLSHAHRNETAGTFADGLSDYGLISGLDRSVDSIETILSDGSLSFFDNVTGGRAFYQVHNTQTGVPGTSSFDRIVSLLDNVQLIAGLQVTENYLRTLAADLEQPLRDNAENLADRIGDALSLFNVRMWFHDGQLRLGGEDDPRLGSAVNRITSESRLAPVVALARGELSQAEFDTIIEFMLSESKSATTPGGIGVERLPFFGTGLEIWAVSPYLTSELDTFFTTNTLAPLAAARVESSQAIGLPAAGATGVSTGFGEFKNFGLSPIDANGNPDHLDVQVLIPPAAGMLAGALGTDDAFENLAGAVRSLRDGGLFDPTYGVPNYQDFGTGLVNEADPVRGTLEIAQMTVGLLNQFLDGRFIEELLRQTSGWSDALDHYAARLNVREAEFLPVGDGNPIPRTNAGGDTVWHLENVSDEVSYTVEIGLPGSFDLSIRYSNNDAGPGDDLTVLLNGTPVGGFTTVNTSDWNVFVEAPDIPLGILPAGTAEITIRLDRTDGFGVDLDRLQLN